MATGSGTGTPATASTTTEAPLSGNGVTRAQYREAVARVFGLHDSIATGGSTSTIVDTKLTRFANDWFNGAHAYIKSADSADPEGEDAWVTDFVSATGTLTISPTLTAAVEADDRYQVYFRVTKHDIDDALDLACVGYEVATTLTPKTDSLDYYITGSPLLMRRNQIIGVWYREHGDLDSLPVEIKGWQLEEAENQLVLRLPDTLNNDDVVWITYYAGEKSLTEDTTLGLPISLVRARAVVYLLENKLNNTTDRDWYGTQVRYWGEKLAQEERKIQRVAKRARAQNWDVPESQNALIMGMQSYHNSYVKPWA